VDTLWISYGKDGEGVNTTSCATAKIWKYKKILARDWLIVDQFFHNILFYIIIMTSFRVEARA
jgi:hypothetical protein